MNNNPLKIYLAGYIQHNKDGIGLMPECIQWRKYIRDYYQNYRTKSGQIIDYGIQFFDPLIGESPEDKLCDALIFNKDYLSIKNSDMLICNFDTFNKHNENVRPPIGTILEMGIAYEMKKQIIVISSEERYIKHPFIQRMACSIFNDVESLCQSKIINIFFKSINTAFD